MARRKQWSFAKCTFLPCRHRDNVPAGVQVYDVSSYADPPWCEFSPLWAHGGIPVPGMPGVVSDSVEGAWQGIPQLFHDLGDNGDVNNPDEGWAHASVLVQYLNGLCDQRLRGGAIGERPRRD